MNSTDQLDIIQKMIRFATLQNKWVDMFAVLTNNEKTDENSAVFEKCLEINRDVENAQSFTKRTLEIAKEMGKYYIVICAKTQNTNNPGFTFIDVKAKAFYLWELDGKKLIPRSNWGLTNE